MSADFLDELRVASFGFVERHIEIVEASARGWTEFFSQNGHPDLRAGAPPLNCLAQDETIIVVGGMGRDGRRFYFYPCRDLREGN